MSDDEVELWPGSLPLSQARWARESSLVADHGVLTVRRGRRARTWRVAGGVLHPAEPAPGTQAGCLVVLVGPDRVPQCTIDLAEWVPGGSMVADRRAGRRLGPPFRDLRDALATALDIGVSSTEWTRALPPRLSVGDLTALRVHQATLLALAVALVVPMLVATPVTGAISGVAAVGLVLLGMSPVRRWHPRSAAPAWRHTAGHLRDELSLSADDAVLWSMDTTTGRAGALPMGPAAWQVSRMDVCDEVVRLSLPEVAVLDLPRDVWGGRRLDDVTASLDRVEGLRRRERPVDRRVERALARGRLPHEPGPVGADLVWAVVTALVAVGAGRVSVLVAVLFGTASAVSLVLAAELLAARRRRVRTDTAAR